MPYLSQLHEPCRLSRIYFRLSMLLILAVSVSLLVAFFRARAVDPVGASIRYLPLIEYILSSVVIATAGVYLLELAQRDRPQ